METMQIPYEIDQEQHRLFFDGFTIPCFRDGSQKRKLFELLNDLYVNEPRDGYKWFEKYRQTFDLYPNTYSYDNVFIDFLFEQGIPKTIERLMGEPLFLGDVSLRNTKNSRSYMNWHRDTSYYGGKPYGRTPPLYKMIIFPQLTDSVTEQIKLASGSHLRFFQNKYIDRLQVYFSSSTSVLSSNSEAVFFNSAMLHAAVGNSHSSGSQRLIYCFCQKSQLSQFEGNEDLHCLYEEQLRDDSY
jgi:hypothetical protein